MELKEAEGDCRQRAQIFEDMVPKSENVQEKGRGTETRAQPGKQSESQTGIQESTLNDVPADDRLQYKDVLDVNRTDTSPADSQRDKKRWKFTNETDSRRINTAIDTMDARIFEERKAESQPPNEQPRHNRRNKNIIVG